MKDNDKNKQALYFKHYEINDLHGCAMSQKLRFGVFKKIENVTEFNKDYIENCNEDSD